MTDADAMPPTSGSAPAPSAAPVPPPSDVPPAPPTPATSPVGIPRIGLTPVVEAAPGPEPGPRSATLLVDEAPRRRRRAEDLLSLALVSAGILSVLVLATYAHETTTGVTADVRVVLSSVLRQVLILPLQTLEGLATFLIPVLVLLNQLLRGRWRGAAESAAGAVTGWALTIMALWTLKAWAPPTLSAGLTVTASGFPRLGVSVVFAALVGLLTAAGERRSSSTVRYGWVAIWMIVGLAVLRSAITLPGALLSLLLGRLAGLALRCLFGVEDHSAHGIALVRALRRAGVDAVRVVRVDSAPGATAWWVTTDAPLGYTEEVRENPLAPESASPAPTTSGDAAGGPGMEPDTAALPPAREGRAAAPSSTIAPAPAIDSQALIAEARSLSPGRPSTHRVYAVWDRTGARHDLTIIDTDRQVAGYLATLWDRIRVRGLSPQRGMSIRAEAEHAALMTLEARRAGVRTPTLRGMADAPESVLLVTDHIAGSRALSEFGPDIPDAVLTGLWDQLRRAHAAGLAHRSLSGDSVVVDEARRVWLLGWDSGETISSELSRRVDLAQALALLAGSVGVERAIASASRVLTTPQLASIAPMLQRVVLPADTRRAMGRRGQVLQELRDALVALTPTAHAEPARINRFQARTVVMAVIFLVAVWTLLARMNFEEVSDAVAQANAWWILGALVFSLATYLGAGIILVAFTPERLSLWRSTEVHLASSVVALVAPAGVGGAAINLRFLTRKGVPTAVGVATVALVQVVQFLVTLVLLVILAAATGQSTGLTLPSGWVLLGAVLLAALVAMVLAVPRARIWIWEKIEPTYRQVRPRLVWILSNPARLLAGVGGAVLLSLSYILAFGASLWAFGFTLPFSVLAIAYFASNTVGSVVPSPGGIGPVEFALTAGLITAGIPSGTALSAAIVYRLVTFWIPIPIGWLSLQRLQKLGEL
ncbi:lysylphosphatidylglycerol synthase transmembrane domain-containing protein [Actinomyces sp. zg328]|uniref:lysylphosphatidylglycerol synthase transmembrane domain-containing protein n=1 Tax=Actinomyces sp. zg328 TaxID=2609287 RepID=UPI001915C34C|nr:lysylphosphatidylglycerol synthase transmembrane domain-containing protein [Actinomyces sp. zg328]